MTDVRIPPAYAAHCHYCGTVVDTRRNGTFQRTSGWVENREAGGANTVALSQRDPVWACHECIDRLRAGVDPHQESLL